MYFFGYRKNNIVYFGNGNFQDQEKKKESERERKLEKLVVYS